VIRSGATWLKKTKPIATALVVVVFGYPAAENDPLNVPLREFLVKNIGLTEPQMESVIAGRSVAKLLETETKAEVAIFGIVKIRASHQQRFDSFGCGACG
jgi:hypothetical protein